MATPDQLTTARGCLALDFPQFVAKELAHLTDDITSALQTVTDPIGALADLNTQGVIDGVAEISQGDIMSNLADAVTGFGVDAIRREANGMLAAMSTAFPNATKRVLDLLNTTEQLVTAGSLILSLVPETPYLAAQRMCTEIVRLIDLKVANLECLRKHVGQLSNAVTVLLETNKTYKDSTLADLVTISAKLATVETELIRSSVIRAGQRVFDAKAFGRARDTLQQVSAILAPARMDSGSVLGISELLIFGSTDSAVLTPSNVKLSTMVIPPLLEMIKVEASAIATQTSVINNYLEALFEVLGNYAAAPVSTKMKELRARLISDLLSRTRDLHERVNLAYARKSVRLASAESMLWASRVKTMLSMMDKVKETTLKEGSIDGPDRAAALAAELERLFDEIRAINSEHTVAGVEDVTELQTKATALALGAERIVASFDTRPPSQNQMATFNQLATQTALRSHSLADQSTADATRLRSACQRFAQLPIANKQKYDQLLDTLGHLGLDRAKDLLTLGKYADYINAGIDDLSYLGLIIKCLKEIIDATDDTQTKASIGRIREKLIGQRTNQSLSLVDRAQRRTNFIGTLQDRIDEIQHNAKVVAGVLEQFKELADKVGVNVTAAISGISELATNADHLAVGAGGRLATGLEQFSKHPNAGVPLC